MNTKYLNFNYLHKSRWMSYWYQLKEISALESDTVLEIGPGNKIVADVLAKMGKKVKTMDADIGTNPDFAGDIADPNLKIPASFDTVLCCQVLEHIPYKKFPAALKNLYNLTTKNLVVSLPYTSKNTLCLKLYIPLWNKKIIKLFSPFPVQHVYNGIHYWEIGKRGYSLSRILKEIEKVGFKILKNYSLFENPYHYIIVCQK